MNYDLLNLLILLLLAQLCAPAILFILFIIIEPLLIIKEYFLDYINRCSNKGHWLITTMNGNTSCKKCFKIFNNEEIHEEYIKFITND